jgi:hypothetical protein
MVRQDEDDLRTIIRGSKSLTSSFSFPLFLYVFNDTSRQSCCQMPARFGSDTIRFASVNVVRLNDLESAAFLTAIFPDPIKVTYRGIGQTTCSRTWYPMKFCAHQ